MKCEVCNRYDRTKESRLVGEEVLKVCRYCLLLSEFWLFAIRQGKANDKDPKAMATKK